MAAGTSAANESRRQFALAEAHDRAAIDARAAAGRYGAASVSEKQIARTLSPLAVAGYHFLPDRQWPGSRTAQVDLVVVGPGGVFIVDAKCWKNVAIVGERLFRDDEDVTDDLEKLADLAYRAEAAFAAIGLPPGEVRPMIVLSGRTDVSATIRTVEIVGERDALRHIAARGHRLTDHQVNAALLVALTHFPVLGALLPASTAVADPVPDAPDMALDMSELMSTTDVEAAMLTGILAAPTEEWMTFLHPDQARLVRRSFNGPSRIRGSAGTGKTVVGLHRAAYLARSRPGTVLVTTFVRTLPAVMSVLLARMAPEIHHRVEFTGVHQFARKVLDLRGITVTIDPHETDAAFSAAWSAVGRRGSLPGLDPNPGYWSDEISAVIKGRGLAGFADYADSARTGRQRRLTVEHRREVWALHVAYTAQLRARGVHDFADLILLAEASLRETPLTGYSAVIVDEAQDLSCAMIRMLYSLVGDAPDAFTLIGDGQQSVYVGGYTLAEAGISLLGRGVVMNINYRNTAEIVDYARAFIDGTAFVDIEGGIQGPDGVLPVPRHGPAPVVTHFLSPDAQDTAMIARIREVTRDIGTSLGDVGVLALTVPAVNRVLYALKQAGIPAVDLVDYDGRSRDRVKVGTVKRAKGLEFKQVLVPSVSPALLAVAQPAEPVARPAEPTGRPSDRVENPGPASRDEVGRERRERDRRELYVAMTRARDGLWIGDRD